MKTNSSPSSSARSTLAVLLCLTGIGLLCSIPFIATRAQATGGTINPNGSGSGLTWTGSLNSPGGNIQESTCIDPPSAAASCEIYQVFVGGAVSDWSTAQKKVQVLLSWAQSTNEYDIYIHQGQGVDGPLVTSAIQGPGLTNQVAFIDPVAAGVGYFTIHIAYDTTATASVDHYTGTISAVPTSGGGGGVTAPAAPLDTKGKIGFENYEAPGVLTDVIVTSSGAKTVEYMGRGAGEPSIGVNWKSASASAVGGTVNMQSDLETLFVSFVDPHTSSATTPVATWVNRRAPTSVAIDSDPIGFTDHDTGRVFAGELTLLSPDTPKISFTDNDGVNWTPAPLAQGPASAVDHETIGGGPYHAPLPSNLPGVYPHAFYYCSQDIAAAFCARSDDGGLSLGTQTPLYDLTQCGGLHGHVKVAPDGTVYVPNRSCGGNTAVVVSTDNGTTWSVRPITTTTVPSTPSTDDPAVGIDSDGTVYALFALNGSQAAVAVSHDQGQTWTNIYDVGAVFGVKNAAFPAAIGGSSGRAAVAFYGSTTSIGDSSADQFPGVWHLYVAETFDGGAHWTTSDATPTLPMQRMGLLRGGGGAADRNLLDFFDINVDKDGRVVVGYVNGCSGGPCSQASPTAVGNAYTTTATIARQSSGRRLFVANDLASATSAPGMPFVTATRVNGVVKLAWNEADTGNLSISNYKIYRGTASGAETLLTSVGNVNSYTDTTATDPTQTYYYQVVAKNRAGSSPQRNEISVPFVGDTCSGLIIHTNPPGHPESTGGSTVGQPPTPQLLIDSIAVGEPPGTSNFMFKMKVGNLSSLPPNSRWRIVWNWVGPASNPNPDEQFFVGMRTDSNSAPTFEYGTVATLSLVVLGVPQENLIGSADPASNFNPDGTITIFVPKSAVGNPQPGDLLGAVNGRTFTGDTPETNTLERSTLLIDHTFVKGNTDNSYPAATYTIAGNNVCAPPSPTPTPTPKKKPH